MDGGIDGARRRKLNVYMRSAALQQLIVAATANNDRLLRNVGLTVGLFKIDPADVEYYTPYLKDMKEILELPCAAEAELKHLPTCECVLECVCHGDPVTVVHADYIQLEVTLK
jgi:hypothetical protein